MNTFSFCLSNAVVPNLWYEAFEAMACCKGRCVCDSTDDSVEYSEYYIPNTFVTAVTQVDKAAMGFRKMCMYSRSGDRDYQPLRNELPNLARISGNFFHFLSAKVT